MKALNNILFHNNNKLSRFDKSAHTLNKSEISGDMPFQENIFVIIAFLKREKYRKNDLTPFKSIPCQINGCMSEIMLKTLRFRANVIDLYFCT